MFESIVIRRHQANGEIDAGLLAETLLYYSSVHIIFNQVTLASLLRSIGPETLLRLLDEEKIKGTFYADNLGTITNTKGGIPFHDYAAFSISKDRNGSSISPKEWVRRGIEQTLGKGAATNDFSKRFLKATAINFFEPTGKGGLTQKARQDINDRQYVQDAAELILREAIPEIDLPRGWFFYAVPMQDEDFVACTNLDFGALNTSYHKHTPPEVNSITPAWILNRIFDARGDIEIASKYMAELATDETTSKIAQRKVIDLFRSRDKSAHEIVAFQNIVLDEAAGVREAINSGEKTFDEYLRVLGKAGRFKEWLRSRNPDRELLKEYQQAIKSESWFNSLPSKIARFSLFAASGPALELLVSPGVGMAGAAVLTAADQFLFDRLVEGWKPNQFVEGPLNKFTA